MSIICVRHTRPDVLPGTCYGYTDLSLAETFEIEAKSVIKTLTEKHAPPARIISSPLQRCHRLAEKISAAFTASITLDERLKEMDFGSWEGRLWDDVPRDELDGWADDFLHARPHGGESVFMLRERVKAAAAHYNALAAQTLWVSHAGIIKAAMARGDTADDFNISVDFGGIIAIPAT